RLPPPPTTTLFPYTTLFRSWKLERRGRRLIDATNAPVPLSKGEYALLLAFLEAPERPLSREHLLQATRIHEDIFDRSIDVQVLRSEERRVGKEGRVLWLT